MVKFVPVVDTETPLSERILTAESSVEAAHRRFHAPHSLSGSRSNHNNSNSSTNTNTNTNTKTDRGWKQGEVGWGVLRSFGNEEKDSGAQVQRERQRLMEKDARGLWVKKTKNESERDRETDGDIDREAHIEGHSQIVGRGRGRGGGGESVLGKLLQDSLTAGGGESAVKGTGKDKNRDEDVEKGGREDEKRYKDVESDSESGREHRVRHRRNHQRHDSREAGSGERGRGRERSRDRRQRSDSRSNRRGTSKSDRRRSRTRSREKDRTRGRERRVSRDRGKSGEKRRKRSSSSRSHSGSGSESSTDYRRRHDDRKSQRRHSTSRSRSYDRKGKRDKTRNYRERDTYRRSESPPNRKKARSQSSSKSRSQSPTRNNTVEKSEIKASGSNNLPDSSNSIKVTAIQVVNHFQETFSNAKLSESSRLREVMDVFNEDCKIMSLKSLKVYMEGSNQIESSFQQTKASSVTVCKRIYMELDIDKVEASTFCCDFHRKNLAPGLGDPRKENVLLYECKGAKIMNVWGMVDLYNIADNDAVTEKDVFASKLWLLVRAIVGKTWGLSTDTLEDKVLKYAHFHDYDHMEVWG